MPVPPMMPMPQMPQETPFDTGNVLLTEQPARLITAVVDTPAGQRLAYTIRTPSTTVTVFLAKGDVENWAKQGADAAGKMSAAGLTVAGPMMPLGNGRPPT